jgi:hypothetical protein
MLEPEHQAHPVEEIGIAPPGRRAFFSFMHNAPSQSRLPGIKPVDLGEPIFAFLYERSSNSCSATCVRSPNSIPTSPT